MNNITATAAFQRARRALLLDHMFFASIVMHLKEEVDTTTDVAWTDGKRLGYNPEAFAAMPVLEAAGVIAHEAMHCACFHHLRRGDRDPETWNEACDYAINPLILKSGLPLPAGALVDARFNNMSANQIYDILWSEKQQQKQQQQKQQQAGEQGSGEEGEAGSQPSDQPGTQPSDQPSDQPGAQPPRPGSATGEVRDLAAEKGEGGASEAERAENEEEWKVTVQQAMNNAKMRGNMPSDVARQMVANMVTPPSLGDELRRFFKSISKDDLSWNRPNRRFIGRRIYLPSAHSERMGTLVFVVDTSGSIGERILNHFATHVNTAIEDVQPERVILIYADAAVQTVEEYSADDMPIPFSPRGGGGTDFAPAFAYIEREGIEPDALVYLTDLDGYFPKETPEYPVLWAATASRTQPPFGEVVDVKLY